MAWRPRREPRPRVRPSRPCGLRYVWRSVTAWGTALAWWTVDLDEAAVLVPHPVEVEEILWLSEADLFAEPALLEGNREFLAAVREGRVRL